MTNFILDLLVVLVVSVFCLVAAFGLISVLVNGIWLVKDIRSDGWRSIFARRTWRTGPK